MAGIFPARVTGFLKYRLHAKARELPYHYRSMNVVKLTVCKLPHSFVFLLAFLLQNGAVMSQTDSFGVRNESFQDREAVSYKIYYSVAGIYLEAGSVNFKCKFEEYGSKPVYHIVAYGKTQPFYDRFYKVRDQYETYIDTGTLLSNHFIRSVEESTTKKYENIKFDRQTHTVISDSGVYKVPPNTMDVLGALYYIRNLSVKNLKPGDKIFFKMFLENKLFTTYVRYMGREIITTKYGRFRAIKIKPLLINGTMFESGEKMTVWVSDDMNHIPVRIQASIRIGSVKADLMEFENLRWPLASLIKRQN